jgi:hypothetical protein
MLRVPHDVKLLEVERESEKKVVNEVGSEGGSEV